MKKILITGAGSYIGTSFENWVSQWPDQYHVDTIDMTDANWKEKSFSTYDVIYHLAAIVHVNENDRSKYYEVNRDLAVEVAHKAKIEGVGQFIFLSTMGVYGLDTGRITGATKPNPKTPYAKSKLEAEKLLQELSDDTFKISILRPPIVYGKGCRGNYPRLVAMALKLSIFPIVNNERSMIFVDNLSEFVKTVIDQRIDGLLFPQNLEYVNTTELVKLIAEAHNKRIHFTNFFNPLIFIGIKVSKTFGKVFGNCRYDKKMLGGPEYKEGDTRVYYQTCTFVESLFRTEN